MNVMFLFQKKIARIKKNQFHSKIKSDMRKSILSLVLQTNRPKPLQPKSNHEENNSTSKHHVFGALAEITIINDSIIKCICLA